jgi:hypothetical protein
MTIFRQQQASLGVDAFDAPEKPRLASIEFVLFVLHIMTSSK